jgi:hypothetical protein
LKEEPPLANLEKSHVKCQILGKFNLVEFVKTSRSIFENPRKKQMGNALRYESEIFLVLGSLANSKFF